MPCCTPAATPEPPPERKRGALPLICATAFIYWLAVSEDGRRVCSWVVGEAFTLLLCGPPLVGCLLLLST